jgi:hypothetical protein
VPFPAERKQPFAVSAEAFIKSKIGDFEPGEHKILLSRSISRVRRESYPVESGELT